MPDIDSRAIRSVVTDDEFGGFRITIAAPVNGQCVAGCWVVFWTMTMGVTLLYIASDPGENFSGGIKILGVLMVIGLLPLLLVVVTANYREELIIDGKTLVLRLGNAWFSSTHTFDLAGVKNLRPSFTSRAVVFEHGGKIHRFGTGVGLPLSKQEVVRLVKTIRLRFPIRDDLDDAEPLPVVE